jgi:hydroxymethylglutaryl-CoA reductase (NADPH)
MVVVLGYFLMHFTFVVLFVNMRKIGSKISLGLMTLLSGALALCASLVLVSICGIPISLIHLTCAIWSKLFFNIS